MAKRGMTQAAQAALDQVLRLSPEERAKVLNGIQDSLDPIDPDIEAAWVRVAESRRADYEAGRVQTIPLEDVLRRPGK